MKRFSDYKQIVVNGSLDGSINELTAPSDIRGKNFIIDKIIPQFYYRDALSQLKYIGADYKEPIQNNLRLNFYINKSLVGLLYQIPINQGLENLNLFVENLENLSFDGVIQGSTDYLDVTFLIYGYISTDSLAKTKSKMIYDT